MSAVQSVRFGARFARLTDDSWPLHPIDHDQGWARFVRSPVGRSPTIYHSLAPVEKAQKTREEWNRTVTRMVSQGAELDEDEQSALIEYLTETYGP